MANTYGKRAGFRSFTAGHPESTFRKGTLISGAGVQFNARVVENKHTPGSVSFTVQNLDVPTVVLYTTRYISKVIFSTMGRERAVVQTPSDAFTERCRRDLPKAAISTVGANTPPWLWIKSAVKFMARGVLPCVSSKFEENRSSNSSQGVCYLTCPSVWDKIGREIHPKGCAILRVTRFLRKSAMKFIPRGVLSYVSLGFG